MKNNEKIVKNLQKGIAAAEASEGSLVTISLREARKLLNTLQHQPHLLSLEEANSEEVVFVEVRDNSEIITTVRFEFDGVNGESKPAWISPYINLDNVYLLADEESYGKDVRYWSARPSEELRKETPW